MNLSLLFFSFQLLPSIPWKEAQAFRCAVASGYEVISIPQQGIKQVTYAQKPMKGVDLTTFETMGQPTEGEPNRCPFRPQYAKDKNSIFYKGERIEGADAGTFKIVSERGIGSDQKRDYCGKTALPNGERLNSLSYPNGYVAYYKSQSIICKSGTVLSVQDPASFALIADGYTKDDKAIYCNDKILNDADPNTFKFEPSYDVEAGQLSLASKNPTIDFYKNSFGLTYL